MIVDENNIGHYIAEEGKVIVSKNMTENNCFSTNSIWLSNFDSIDNYEEVTIEEWEVLKEKFDKEKEIKE